MFLPLKKTALFYYNKIFCPPPLLCDMPKEQIFLGGHIFSLAILPLMRIFPPFPKMESAQYEKNPGHAFLYDYISLNLGKFTSFCMYLYKSNTNDKSGNLPPQ